MEEKNGKKITIIILAILLFVTLLGGGYLAYDKYIAKTDAKKYNALKNKNTKLKSETAKLQSESTKLQTEYTELKAELEKNKKDAAKNTSNNNEKNYIVWNENSHIYDIKIEYAVVGKNNNMYLISDNGGGHLNALFDCETTTASGKVKAKKLNISESNISRVRIISRPAASDTYAYVYFIMKDGSVKEMGIDSTNPTLVKKLSSYKVKDIDLKCASGKTDAETCGGAVYHLTLQDGTTKQVKE